LIFVYILILIGSCIPGAASNVYKEYSLKNNHVDVWYLNAWVAFWQFLFGLLTAPLVFTDIGSGGNPISPEHLGDYLKSSVLCFIGQSTLEHDELCYEAPWVFLVFIAFNITFNASMLYVFKYGSATLATIAGVLRVFFSAALFQIPIIAGPASGSLTVFHYVAVGTLLLGLIVYRAREEKQRKEEVEVQSFVDDIENN